MKYVLDPSKIKCGDILIENTHENPLISEATNCEYTHAILCDHFPKAYEADGLGVTEISLYVRTYSNIDDVILLRPNMCDIQDERELILMSYPKELFGTRYGTLEARRMIGERPEKALAPNRQICTRLITQAYARININLVENIDYPLIKDLLNSDKLERIDNVLVEISQEEENELPKPHPLEEFPFFLDLILDHARNLYGEDIQNIKQLVDLVIKFALENKFLEKDINMEAFMREQNFFISEEKVMEHDAHLYDYNAFIEYTKKVFPHLEDYELEIKRKQIAALNIDSIKSEMRMQLHEATILENVCQRTNSPLLSSLLGSTKARISLNIKRLELKAKILEAN